MYMQFTLLILYLHTYICLYIYIGMEINSLIPLSYGAERLILIGDQNQLPPIVASPIALEFGLGVSLFSRLVAGGLKPKLLNEQYRMHPRIAEFPSKLFYHNKLVSKVTAEERPLPLGIEWSNRDVPVLFINISPFTPFTPVNDTPVTADVSADARDDADAGDGDIGAKSEREARRRVESNYNNNTGNTSSTGASSIGGNNSSGNSVKGGGVRNTAASVYQANYTAEESYGAFVPIRYYPIITTTTTTTILIHSLLCTYIYSCYTSITFLMCICAYII